MKSLIVSTLVLALAQQTLAEDPIAPQYAPQYVPQYIPPAPKPAVVKPTQSKAALLRLIAPTTIKQISQPQPAPIRAAQPLPRKRLEATPHPVTKYPVTKYPVTNPYRPTSFPPTPRLPDVAPTPKNQQGLTSFLYPVQHIAAEEAAHSLGRAFAIKFLFQKKNASIPLVVIPNKTSNTLIVTTSSQSVSEIKQLLSKIDQRPRQFQIKTMIKQTNADGTNETYAPTITVTEGDAANIKISTPDGSAIELTVNVKEITPTPTTASAKPVAIGKIYPSPPIGDAALAHRIRELKKQITAKFTQSVKQVKAESTPQKTEREKEVERALEKNISLHFEKTKLEEIFRHITGVAKINVVLDNMGLEEEGLTSDTPVTIDVEDITLESALGVLLKPLNLDYKIEDEVLKITSRMRKQGPLQTRTYPIAELLKEKNDSDTLIDILETQIDPNSWAKYGGPASLHPYTSTRSLVVRQTKENHEKIAKLIKLLKELKRDDSDAKKEKAKAESVKKKGKSTGLPKGFIETF